MDEDLLEAAARVLAREGAARFTTNRVAEAAGVSVGSLYQYYPNKAALLLRLHEREAERLWTELNAVLDDRATAPGERLARIVHGFFQVQGAAADHHLALQEAQALISDTPGFQARPSRTGWPRASLPSCARPAVRRARPPSWRASPSRS